MTMLQWFAVLSWVTCGVAAAGYLYPFLQSGCEHNTDWDRIADRNFALAMCVLGGPAAVVLTVIVAAPGRHGWSLPLSFRNDEDAEPVVDAYGEDEAA